MEIVNYENTYKSKLLIEQHFHGCYGVDFSVCKTEDILFLAKKLLEHGIGGFYPTLVTDSIENIKRQIERIKTAKEVQLKEKNKAMAEILGIHIEGIFINPVKKGIHDEKLFLAPTIENYKLIEDDFIKIVTLAPELDEDGKLRKYLLSKGIKVQAGHCVGEDLNYCTGATHLFNAMKGINHRDKSTSLSALINDEIYTEVIADGLHLSDEILELIFKTKPKDKIILVSDSLPLTKSNLKEMKFAGEMVFYNGERATSKEGTIAGSTAVLNEIINRLSFKSRKNFKSFVKMASDNLYTYHNIELDGCVYWDESFEVVAVEKNGIVLYKQN